MVIIILLIIIIAIIIIVIIITILFRLDLFVSRSNVLYSVVCIVL